MKRKMIFLLAFCGIIVWCVLFQFFIFKTVGNNVFNIFVKFEAAVHLKEFFKQVPGLHEQLLLIDPTILRVYQDRTKHNPYNKDDSCVLCVVGRYQPITFGLLVPSNSSLEEHIVLPILRAWEVGFWVEQFIANPGKFSPYHSQLPLGFVLQKGGGAVVIEIVLLHEHEGDFWWHGSLHQDPQCSTKLKNLKLGDIESRLALNEQGAYDKMVFQPIILDGLLINIPKNTDSFIKRITKYIECNHEQADRFHKKYGKDTTPKALRFIHRARRVIATTKTILDQLNIPFWLSSGTLLGYYRQCSIIPYTTDVDIGIRIEDYNSTMVAEFQQRQLTLKQRLGEVNDGLELSFLSNHVKLDIFFFYKGNRIMWNGGHKAVWAAGKLSHGLKFRYIFPEFTLCWTEWLALKVRVPCNTEEYIKTNYGPDWFVPNPTWHWYKSPFNVKLVGTWTPEEVTNVIRLY